ncbi:hypothetical protein V8C26DRAFT_413921 [Trichoderma gracile]
MSCCYAVICLCFLGFLQPAPISRNSHGPKFRPRHYSSASSTPIRHPQCTSSSKQQSAAIHLLTLLRESLCP